MLCTDISVYLLYTDIEIPHSIQSSLYLRVLTMYFSEKEENLHICVCPPKRQGRDQKYLEFNWSKP